MDAYFSAMQYSPLRQQDDEDEELVDEERCKQGHRPSLQLRTSPGGCICLLCFSNLITQSLPLLTHKAYAISQFSQALNDALFRNTLLQNHRHFLVSPLSHAICHCTDEALGKDITEIITKLCRINSSDDVDDDANDMFLQDFILHLVLQLTSSALVWSRGQTYTLHCLGLLLELHCSSCNAVPNSMRNQQVFVFNMVSGLRLPSDEIRGEILFVLYKLSNLQDGLEELLLFCPRLIHLAVEALLKTESDELRTNCLALLTMLARQAVFDISLPNFDDEEEIPMETDSFAEITRSHESPTHGSFVRTFAEAVKGPLLSSDVQVQISTLELIYYACPIGVDIAKELQILVEGGTADYIFEILRLADNMEPLVLWSVRVLSLLSTAERAFTQRFSVGFTTISRVLGYVAEIALHPVQTDILLLISAGLTNCPGIVSTAQAEELLIILTKMLKSSEAGAIGLSPDALNAACSTFVALLKSPSCGAIKSLVLSSIPEAVKNAIASASDNKDGQNLLYSLYFFKEAYIFTLKENNRTASDVQMAKAGLVEICEIHLLPSLETFTENEETTHALFQTYQLVLQDRSLVQTTALADKLAVSSWFSFSFECLARFPSVEMREDVFVIFSLLIDRFVGDGMGDSITEASFNLPSDPLDLLFLLGQKSSYNSELLCSQSAIISILHASYLYGDRLADDNQVLASIEQFILVNASNFSCGLANTETLIQILHLYAFIRDTHENCPASYSVEAEKLLLRIIAECECDLWSARMTKAVLRWLVQQDEIQKFLMSQILNLCRCIYEAARSTELEMETDDALGDQNHGSLLSDIMALAELIEQEDCGTAVLVSLLNQMGESAAEDDLRAVLHILMRILKLFPGAANRFHAHGIIGPLHQFYYAMASPETLTSCTVVVFSILYFGKPEAIIEEDLWLAVTNRVIQMLVARLKDKNSANREGVLLLSLLTLIMQKSIPENGLLMEACKTVIFNSQLGSAVEDIIEKACSRGPALAQVDEQSSSGKFLISALVFHLFWLRSFSAVLQESIDWQDFPFIDCYDLHDDDQALHPDVHTTKYSSLTINIKCQQLCRLLYFGPPLVKLVASYSLVEVFSHIAERKADDNNSKRELKCPPKYLQSVVAVLQGFILQDNIFIAKNAASCIYWLLGCEHLNAEQHKAVWSSNWYRLILEELMLALATPNSLSYSLKSCAIQRKPAAYVAIALLRVSPQPLWIKSVFSLSSIRSIIENLSSYKPGPEIVLLFRELLCAGYIDQDQISRLHHLFQDFRKCIYMENPMDRLSKEHAPNKLSYIEQNCNKMSTLMVDLVMSVSVDPVTVIRSHTMKNGNKETEYDSMRLIAELDKFLQESATYLYVGVD